MPITQNNNKILNNINSKLDDNLLAEENYQQKNYDHLKDELFPSLKNPNEQVKKDIVNFLTCTKFSYYLNAEGIKNLEKKITDDKIFNEKDEKNIILHLQKEQKMIPISSLSIKLMEAYLNSYDKENFFQIEFQTLLNDEDKAILSNKLTLNSNVNKLNWNDKKMLAFLSLTLIIGFGSAIGFYNNKIFENLYKSFIKHKIRLIVIQQEFQLVTTEKMKQQLNFIKNLLYIQSKAQTIKIIASVILCIAVSSALICALACYKKLHNNKQQAAKMKKISIDDLLVKDHLKKINFTQRSSLTFIGIIVMASIGGGLGYFAGHKIHQLIDQLILKSRNELFKKVCSNLDFAILNPNIIDKNFIIMLEKNVWNVENLDIICSQMKEQNIVAAIGVGLLTAIAFASITYLVTSYYHNSKAEAKLSEIKADGNNYKNIIASRENLNNAIKIIDILCNKIEELERIANTRVKEEDNKINLKDLIKSSNNYITQQKEKINNLIMEPNLAKE